MSELRWVTFDCFGTLVDWRHGITTAADLLYPGRGAELLEAYNRHEPVIQTETPAMRYREVMAEALRRATGNAGLELVEDNAGVLAATIPYWPVFPDTRAALAELRRADWRLALLTNCDRDLIAQTQRRLGVPVDAVVTAEDVGAYKPSHDHFTRFERSFGASRDRWVHVAQSWVHDMVPAKALRIPRVWVNRHHDPQDPAIADAVMPDLNGLLETVEQVRGATT
jgi:2-haloacid dehalogenase